MASNVNHSYENAERAIGVQYAKLPENQKMPVIFQNDLIACSTLFEMKRLSQPQHYHSNMLLIIK